MVADSGLRSGLTRQDRDGYLDPKEFGVGCERKSRSRLTRGIRQGARVRSEK